MDKGWSIRFVCTAILAVFGLSGCYEPEPRPHIIGEDRPIQMPAVEAIPRFRVLGHSVQGRPILAQVLGDENDTTLFIATIHGNEAVGTPLMRTLAAHLTEHPELLKDRRVVVVAVANPDGMAMRTRANVHGVDLNRNFEASNRLNNATNGQRADGALLPAARQETGGQTRLARLLHGGGTRHPDHYHGIACGGIQTQRPGPLEPVWPSRPGGHHVSPARLEMTVSMLRQRFVPS